jgi:hypothetical protein
MLCEEPKLSAITESATARVPVNLTAVNALLACEGWIGICCAAW